MPYFIVEINEIDNSRFTMLTVHIKSKYPYGNWFINLSVLLCNTNIIISESCESNNESDYNMPPSWPCQWNNGVIDFAFDFFSLSPKRLMSLVHKGHSYIEQRSCLTFVEHNPKDLSRRENFTYLFYSYSEVLESCCLPFFTKAMGRRLVLITPVCTLPAEVAHATLHALGLTHKKYESFGETKSMAVMFPYDCIQIEEKMMEFKKKVI